jgi:hypothetical protein
MKQSYSWEIKLTNFQKTSIYHAANILQDIVHDTVNRNWDVSKLIYIDEDYCIRWLSYPNTKTFLLGSINNIYKNEPKLNVQNYYFELILNKIFI